MSRLVIFDLDGTLIDSKEDLARAVNHALGRVGAPVRSVEEVTRFVGDGAAQLLRRSIAPNEQLLEPALDSWWEYYRDHLLDTTVLYPGMAELLSRARCELAVHTNKPGDLARKILEGLGVGSRFGLVVGGDEAARKPDPAGTLAIMARMGARPEETVLVGDSRVDLETARAAGISFVAVTWGYVSRAELEAAGASVFAHSTSDLFPWVSADLP